MAEAGHVRAELAEGVLEVTFTRPSTRNAMTFEMYDALVDACHRAQQNDVHVMVLRGAAGAFVAGTDIAELEEFVAAHGGVAYEDRIEAAIAALEDVPVPVVAAVDGAAAGAGLLFVLASDICVCTPRSRFGAPMARTLGNCLSIANMKRVVRGVGDRVARTLLLTGSMIDARTALQRGLVFEVMDPTEFEGGVKHLVTRIRENSRSSIRAFKRALRALAQPEAHDLKREDVELIEGCYGSADFREGARAFQEKRAPAWRDP